MKFSHRWRDLGFMFAYILFNIAATYLITYLFTVVDWSNVHILPGHKKEKKQPVEAKSMEKQNARAANSS
jgi:ATP-binding cassette subfamily G (WHITE) protein 2 (SNQ2)